MIINNSFYFIHIPRTGGRFVKNLLSKNFSTQYNFTLKENKKYQDIFGIRSAHWHYPLYLIREKPSMKYFTVLRDPFDKLLSQLKVEYKRNKNLFELLDNRENFYRYIEEHRKDFSYHNNWYRPQVDFLCKKTILWHFGMGLDSYFFNWLESELKLKIRNKSDILSYEKMKDIDRVLEIDYDVSNIKKYTYEYYEKDKELSEKVLNGLKNNSIN